jgi:hypothetical protein
MSRGRALVALVVSLLSFGFAFFALGRLARRGCAVESRIEKSLGTRICWHAVCRNDPERCIAGNRLLEAAQRATVFEEKRPASVGFAARDLECIGGVRRLELHALTDPDSIIVVTQGVSTPRNRRGASVRWFADMFLFEGR